MSKTVKVTYNADTLETTIVVDGKEFDTSRIDNKEIADWAYPFMVRKVRWDGFYDEMVTALGGEKAFDLVFEGSDEALAELKESWEDAPVNIVISDEQESHIITDCDLDELTTEDTVTDQTSDVSHFSGIKKFKILSHELTFSDEKLEYVKLKWEYQRKAWKAEEVMKEALPESKKVGAFRSVSAFFGNTLSDMTSVTGALTSFLSVGDYKHFSIFQDVRKEYVDKYIECLNMEIDELSAQNVIVDKTDILNQILKDSNLKNDLYNVIEKVVSSRSEDMTLGTDETQAAHTRIYNYYVDKANLEYNSDDSVIFSRILQPLNHCFLEIVKSDIGEMYIDRTDANNDKNTINVAQKCSKLVFQLEDIQNALINNLRKDIFGIFIIKKRLMQEAGLKKYEAITIEEINRANELSEQLKNNSFSEDEEKAMMAERLQLDPFQSNYYINILDKYFDENGDIQRLAKETTVKVTPHIEEHLKNIYDNGSIDTLESTLELKKQILEVEAKFSYKDSKAYKDVLFRQHFLELGRIADEMDKETLIATWQSIKDGDNTFTADGRNDVDDESCIIILTRRFLKANAAEYHDVISDLGLTDDQTEGDKNYAFYEEGDNYLEFEEECFKIIGTKLERDDDFANQNYTEDKLASGEVILGYFHYTRAMDLIGDGKCLLITNQRIYTTKEKFTCFENISACTPTKKMLVTSLVFEKTDGKTIQLPVNKELAVPAADMINRLLSALKNEEYVANSAKKGFSSLFGKKK